MTVPLFCQQLVYDNLEVAPSFSRIWLAALVWVEMGVLLSAGEFYACLYPLFSSPPWHSLLIDPSQVKKDSLVGLKKEAIKFWVCKKHNWIKFVFLYGLWPCCFKYQAGQDTLFETNKIWQTYSRPKIIEIFWQKFAFKTPHGLKP